MRATALFLLAALLMAHRAYAKSQRCDAQDLQCPCLTNNSDGSCKACAKNAVMSKPGECEWCTDELCLVCGPSAATCKKCLSFVSDLYDIDASQDAPVYKDPTSGRCTACKAHPRSSGCRACNAQGRCAACGQGYVLANGACKKCKAGCVSCRADALQQCSSCLEGFALTNKTCVPCTTLLKGCSVCKDSRTCTKCSDPAAYLSRRNTCEPCTQPNCLVCDRDGKCSQCAAGFTFVGSVCKPCTVNFCDACAPGKPGICTACGVGAYVGNGGRSCLPCGPDCWECKDAQTCTNCKFLTLSGGRCKRCDDPRCADCSDNAAVCRSCKWNIGAYDYTPDRATKRCWPGAINRSAALAPGGRRLLSGVARNSSTAATGQAPSRPKPAIVGGDAAQQGRFPWAASLRANSQAQGFAHFCTSSLVHPQVLLTAAHCVTAAEEEETGKDWAKLAWALPQVRLGAYETDGGQYQERYAKWVVVHPMWRVKRDDYDVALLLLEKPAAAGTPIVRLAPSKPRPAVAPGTQLTAIGWGLLEDGASDLPAMLQEVAVPMLAMSKCKAAYPDQAWESQFCAGVPNQKDTCQGDSGGPLFRKGASATADVQVGVTSWGYKCAGPTPGVYADVASVRGWIDSTIKFLLSEEKAGRFPPVEYSAA